ncbi:MAG: universal stress protein [Saprospiraceae bacterium]
MTQILIPTDFSACAKNALDTGFALANITGAEVHLLHCISIAKEEGKDSPEVKNARLNAETLLLSYQKENPEIKSSFKISDESFLESMPKLVEEKNIDLVVMGSHGASGKNEFFIGSNTQKVARLIHRPILVVKEKIDRLKFKKVVYASGFNEDEKHVFQKFLKLIRIFEPEIHLVAINTSSLFDAPLSVTIESMEQFKTLASPLDCKIHLYRDFTIESGIRHFSKEIDADLIGISNHHRSPLKRMLVGSSVEALINHAHIPVLSMDFD